MASTSAAGITREQHIRGKRSAVCRAGVNHIVEVAFGANVEADVELLKEGGSIRDLRYECCRNKYSVLDDGFQKHQAHFPIEAKIQAARDLNRALEARWPAF